MRSCVATAQPAEQARPAARSQQNRTSSSRRRRHRHGSAGGPVSTGGYGPGTWDALQGSQASHAVCTAPAHCPVARRSACHGARSHTSCRGQRQLVASGHGDRVGPLPPHLWAHYTGNVTAALQARTRVIVGDGREEADAERQCIGLIIKKSDTSSCSAHVSTL